MCGAWRLVKWHIPGPVGSTAEAVGIGIFYSEQEQCLVILNWTNGNSERDYKAKVGYYEHCQLLDCFWTTVLDPGWLGNTKTVKTLWYEHREMCYSNTVQRVSIWFVKDTFKNVVVRGKTYAMFSGSVAQAPTALVTLTRRAWLVPVSKLTKGWIPLLLRMVARFSDIWPHSPKAPTTLISTSSGWSLSRPTRVSSALYSWNLWERKRARNYYSYACPKCFQWNNTRTQYTKSSIAYLQETYHFLLLPHNKHLWCTLFFPNLGTFPLWTHLLKIF